MQFKCKCSKLLYNSFYVYIFFYHYFNINHVFVWMRECETCDDGSCKSTCVHYGQVFSNMVNSCSHSGRHHLTISKWHQHICQVCISTVCFRVDVYVHKCHKQTHLNPHSSPLSSLPLFLFGIHHCPWQWTAKHISITIHYRLRKGAGNVLSMPG